jgi:hypothetical protein
MSTLRTHLARLHRQRRPRTAYPGSTPRTRGAARVGADHSVSAQPSHPSSPVVTGLR